MAWDEIGRALALVLVIEGMGPFLAPRRWRLTMVRMAQLNERALRLIGFASMLLGLIAMQVLSY